MTTTSLPIEQIEEILLSYLRSKVAACSISDLISGVRTQLQIDASPEKIKVAAMNLVSQGKARFTPEWKIARP